jgi:hypothetical protein
LAAEEGEGYFADAADIDHRKVIGDIGGHDALVHPGMPKVIDAGDEVEGGHAIQGEPLHIRKLQQFFVPSCTKLYIV